MAPIETGRKRRKYKRFSPSRDFFVYVKSGRKFILGRLVDLGLGGLSLECLSDCGEQEISALADTPCDLGIFLSSRQFFLSDIRASLIYSREQDSNRHSFLGSRFKRCGFSFEDLDQKQEQALREFMTLNELSCVE